MSYNRDGDEQLVHDHKCPICLDGDLELPEEDEVQGVAECSNKECGLYMEAKSQDSINLLVDMAQTGRSLMIRTLRN